MFKKELTENDIYIARLRNEDDTLIIGVSKESKNIAYSLVSHAMSFVYELADKAHGIKNVEFIFTDGIDGVPSFNEWVEQSGVATDDAHAKFKYIQYLKTLDISKHMDRAWEALQMGCSTHTGAITLHLNGKCSFVPSTTFTEHYNTPVVAREGLTKLLEERYGHGNIFVSRQLITMRAALNNWREFCDQANAFLVRNERFWKACYDDQVHPAGEIVVPGYVVPVGIKKEWPRRFTLDEHADFMLSLSEPLGDLRTLSRFFNELHGIVLDTHVCSLPDISSTFNELINTAYDIAEMAGYKLPGQPSKLKSAFRRFVKRMQERKASQMLLPNAKSKIGNISSQPSSYL